jgi:hypothetical protein
VVCAIFRKPGNLEITYNYLKILNRSLNYLLQLEVVVVYTTSTRPLHVSVPKFRRFLGLITIGTNKEWRAEVPVPVSHMAAVIVCNEEERMYAVGREGQDKFFFKKNAKLVTAAQA